MGDHLDAVEIRILGSLVEKALSTPDYYPLSLNALVNACNQKSSRDPIVAYDITTIEAALENLVNKGFVDCSRVGRVPKYEERFSRTHDLVPPEMAVLGVMLLRGPQTAGEIRSRTARMHRFAKLEDVLATLDRLADWGLSCRLDRQPGRKEARFTHLLAPPPDAVAPGEDQTSSGVRPPEVDRLEALEKAVAGLQGELTALQQAFEVFKSQFE